MSISLVDLPEDVIEQILLFVPSPIVAIRVGATCSTLTELVHTNERIWNLYYRKRWTYKEASEDQVFTCLDYRDRHLDDGETLRMLLEVSKQVEKERDYGLGRDYHNPLWDELFRRLDSFDLLMAVANDAPEIMLLYQKHVSLVTKSLATQLLDDVHYRNVHLQFNELLSDIHEGNYSRGNPWEEGLLLLVESQRRWDDLLSFPASPFDRMKATRRKLYDLGRELQCRLDQCSGNMTTLEAVKLLHMMLVDERSITVATVDDKIEYLSIDHVLQSKEGSPIILAIMCHSILRHVGISVSIANVSKRVVLGMPGGDTFVDVFSEGCQTLSIDEVRALPPISLLATGAPLQSIQLKSSEIFDVVLDDMYHFYMQVSQLVKLGRVSVAIIRSTNLRLPVQGMRVLRAMPSAFEPLQDAHANLDPEIFRHFKLINYDTMRRHLEGRYARAPYWYEF